MKRSVDARGKTCPQPVLMTRKAMSEGGIDEIEVIVDNEPARENVVRFLTFAGVAEPRVTSTGRLHTISAAVTPAIATKSAGGEPALGLGEELQVAESRCADKILFFSADQLGRGDESLGKLLVRGLIYTLSEMATPPKALVFMNSAVRLAAEPAETINLLKTLQAKGVEILVCGTCLDFFHLKENLSVGRISNIFEITDKFLSSGDVVTVS